MEHPDIHKAHVYGYPFDEINEAYEYDEPELCQCYGECGSLDHCHADDTRYYGSSCCMFPKE
jgi:hypothetical protein